MTSSTARNKSNHFYLTLLIVAVCLALSQGLTPQSVTSPSKPTTQQQQCSSSLEYSSSVVSSSRRNALFSLVAGAGWMGGMAAGGLAPVWAADDEGSLDVENYLRTGGVAMPMGVSGQSGKSKPETGVVLRDGTEVLQDSRSGNVLAEVIVKEAQSGDKMAVVAAFTSPWKLATGTVYDVECRDPKTGDGAFLAVTPSASSSSISDLKNSFFVDALFSPSGRFSSYGQPTDIKVKKSSVVNRDGREYRMIDISFATLSQSTQTEIPRFAQVMATIPEGASQAIMLVGSASALRWKKSGVDQVIASTMESFRAIPAPQTSLKLRGKA